MSVFHRFAPRLQEAIVARLGWSSLRPVQDEAGEALLRGDNAIILAPTAGGKTEAAMFPALSQMVDDGPEGVGVLYVAPIKALLNNQAERLGLYTEMVGLHRFVWHGDVPTNARQKFLREPAELLMTTPESLEVMLVSQRVNTHKLFRDLRMVVIDEIHAMAGTDRGAHLISVIERLAAISRHDVQRVGLSATVGNPAAILTWLQGTSTRAGCVVDPPKPGAPRQVLIAMRQDLAAVARDAAKLAVGQKSLFFCQSRATTESVAEAMRRIGTTVFVHHSAVSQEERALAEARFHAGTDACIVCTSTLELGIDVGDLDRVLQADAPATVSAFLQRMGRTGRRPGKVANTTFLCESSESVLLAIALVELAKVGWVEDVDVNPRCWPVLIHQLLALALAADGIGADEAWRHLVKVPDFAGVTREEYDTLVAWLISDETFILASGRLILGPKAQRRFGRKNFMELFSVFTAPQTYAVQTASGQPIGSLEQDFVDRLVDGLSAFLLGGRAWVVLHVQHNDRRIVVEPAPRGREPAWGGVMPQFLGFDVCQRIRQILTEGTKYKYLDDTAAEVVARQRESMAEALVPGRGGFELDADELRWWTFAGGRMNMTLRVALEALLPGAKVMADNLRVRIRGEGLDSNGLREAFETLAKPEFWQNAELWRQIADSLPSYRISKFQPLMPPAVEREVIATHLLDIGGTAAWLRTQLGGRRRLPGAPASIEHKG